MVYKDLNLAVHCAEDVSLSKTRQWFSLIFNCYGDWVLLMEG